MKLSSILLFIILTKMVSAQNVSKQHSLLQTFKQKKDSPEKLKELLQQAELNKNNNVRTALNHSMEALALSMRLTDKAGIIESHLLTGELYTQLGVYDSALLQYNQALPTARQLGDSLKVGVILFNIGSAHRYRNEIETAINYCLQAKPRIEASGNKKWIAKMYVELQPLYYYLPDYEQAIDYGKKAVRAARSLNDSALLIKALSNLSMPYKDKQRFDTSRKLLLESFDLAEQTNNLYSQSAILINLAGVFLEERNYIELKRYAEKSLQISRQLELPEETAISLRGIAISYLQTKSYDSAKKYAEQALSIAEKNNYLLEKGGCYKLLSNIHYALGNVVEGEKFFNRSDDVFEQIFKEENQASAVRFEKLFESKEKDNRILLQQANIRYKSVWNYGLAGGLTTLFLLSLLTYRNYRHRQRIQQQRITELETEKQLAATEAVLKGEEQERTRLAKDLHDGLGGMLSGIKYSFNSMKGNMVMTPDNAQAFERSMDMLDSSIQEMRRVAHNMMPEALVKFGLDTALKDFCNDINASGALQLTYQSIGMSEAVIDQTTAIAVYRIVQELVHNTMKHAAAKKAIVQLAKTNGQLAITVEDDGTGFDTKLLTQPRGIGWSNIQNRVEFLKGTCDVDAAPGKGTSVHIEINA